MNEIIFKKLRKSDKIIAEFFKYKF